ncbi:uncharacterized protein LOC134240937 [Saccostrea cucullata]|uniref:uncharacterized protein LOC134240937 n=1 Tax=Saccostrea cuccullata TaxID=36930 RepID=UPI002ED53A05
MDIGASTGVILDPTYTGKAVRGLVSELQNNPQRFRGKQVLFIHTGGTFGLFDGRMNQLLKQRNTPNSSHIHIWNEKGDSINPN